MVLGSKDLPIISRVKGHDHREGTLDDWREVAALADGNPVMIFAVSRAGGKAFKGEVPLPEPLFPPPRLKWPMMDALKPAAGRPQLHRHL